MAMICPKCGNPSHPLTISGSTLHQCGDCKGYWFERAELELVLGAPLPNILDEPVAVEMKSASGGSRLLELDSGIVCPNCNQPLADHGFRSDETMRIAACNLCLGVFLEPFELNRLRKLAPQIRRTKTRDLERPLDADYDSLKRSLNEANDDEKRAVAMAALEQLENRRHRWLSPQSCTMLGFMAAGIVVMMGFVVGFLFALRWNWIQF